MSDASTTRDEERQERFRAYLDAELSDTERAAFERACADDPELDGEFQRYRRMIQLLRSLPETSEPGRFVERVEGRIRRRSHGTYFSHEPRLRLPYEAVAIIMLLGAMLLLFLSAAPMRETPVIQGDGPAGAASLLDQAAAAFGRHGAVDQRGDTLRLEVSPTKLAAFREALARWPALEIAEERVAPDGAGTLFVLRRRE